MCAYTHLPVVSVNYARQNISSSSSKSATTSVASAAIAQAQWSMVSGDLGTHRTNSENRATYIDCRISMNMPYITISFCSCVIRSLSKFRNSVNPV